MDFLPSRGLREAARRQWRWLRHDELAVVVPAFQRRGGNCKSVAQCRRRVEPLDERVPGTFDGLVECLGSKKCAPFQGDVSPASHSTTDVAAWTAQPDDEVRAIPCFKSDRYEPYVVVNARTAPLYDERFSGYGKNKIQHVVHLRRSGFAFVVLARHFLVHVPHPRSAAKWAWTRSYEIHRRVDALYTTFLRELDVSLEGTRPRVDMCHHRKRKPRRAAETRDEEEEQHGGPGGTGVEEDAPKPGGGGDPEATTSSSSSSEASSSSSSKRRKKKKKKGSKKTTKGGLRGGERRVLRDTRTAAAADDDDDRDGSDLRGGLFEQGLLLARGPGRPPAVVVNPPPPQDDDGDDDVVHYGYADERRS